jgi:long-subunit fatty acid transport protein
MKRNRIGTGILCLLLTAGFARAQFPEDALRFSTPGVGVGARAVGMGGAYTGVAADFSALYWNPAGLAQLTYGETTIGLAYHDDRSTGTLFHTDQNSTTSAFNLNSLGMVVPLEVRRGNAVLAFGFHRQASFAGSLGFEGFNPQSSIVQSWAPNGGSVPSDISNNLAYQLYLANIDTSTNRWDSQIMNRVTQLGAITESGGLNNWSFGGAVDIAKNLSLGVTLTFVSGSYRYDRNYQEKDSKNLYQAYPFDFQSLNVDDFVESDLSGWNAKFGLMYRIPELLRIGFTYQTPTVLAIKEDFGTSAQSVFDQNFDASYSSKSSNEYSVRKPEVLGGGVSVLVRGLLVSADIEHTDWSKLEFTDANSDLIAENASMRKLFRATTNVRFGGEFDLHGFRIRGGYGLQPSPWKDDPSSFDHKTWSAGLGIPLDEGTMVDAAFAHSWWNTFIVNYDATSRVDQAVGNNSFMLTLTHRF